jgi:putative exporter of polyketide antibiotics
MAGKAVEDVERYCRYCEQRVPPVRHLKVRHYFRLAAIAELAAVVVAVVAQFYPLSVDLSTASPIVERFVFYLVVKIFLFALWPAVIKPAWVGLVAAVAAVFLPGIASLGAGGLEVTCPICQLGLEAD